jgi:hypothetical protein
LRRMICIDGSRAGAAWLSGESWMSGA